MTVWGIVEKHCAKLTKQERDALRAAIEDLIHEKAEERFADGMSFAREDCEMANA